MTKTWAGVVKSLKMDEESVEWLDSYETNQVKGPTSRQAERKGRDVRNRRGRNFTGRGARARHGDTMRNQILTDGELQVNLTGEC